MIHPNLKRMYFKDGMFVPKAEENGNLVIIYSRKLSLFSSFKRALQINGTQNMNL